MYRFSAIPIKLPVAFFSDLEQNILQFVWKEPRPPHLPPPRQIAEAVLRKKNGTGGMRLPDFRAYYKATVIMTQEQKYRSEVRKESPEINLLTYGHLSLTEEARIYKREDSLFSKWCW